MKLPLILSLCALARAQPTSSPPSPVATAGATQAKPTTLPAAGPGENMAACEKRQVTAGWFGQPPADPKGCTDCTVATFLTGKGPAYCSKYKNYVASATAQGGKVVINGVAGILPGAFDQVPANVFWFEIGQRPKYGVSTFSSLPDGLFDKMPAAPTLQWVELTTTSGVTFKNPDKFFGRQFPKLERIQFNFSPTQPLVGLGAKLFNKNIATLQRLQMYFGNDAIPADTFSNLPQLRGLNLISNNLKALPADLLKNQKKLKELYLGGSGTTSPDDRYVPMPITTFPATLLANSPSFESLQIRGSKLTQLAPDTFAKNKKFSWLMLLDSNVKSLPADFVKNTPALNQLSVAGNDIASFPPGFFPPGRIIELRFTPQSTGATCKNLSLPKSVTCF